MRSVKNISASVSEKLRNIAKQTGKSFDFILLLYFQPEFDSFEVILGKWKWLKCCYIKDFAMRILGKNVEFHRNTIY